MLILLLHKNPKRWVWIVVIVLCEAFAYVYENKFLYKEEIFVLYNYHELTRALIMGNISFLCSFVDSNLEMCMRSTYIYTHLHFHYHIHSHIF